MIDRTPQSRLPLSGPPAAPDDPDPPRRPRVSTMVIVALVVSGLAGLLSHAAGNNVPAAVLTGGGAFAGALGLFLAFAHYADLK